MNISAGGTVNTGTTQIGYDSGSTGLVTVYGAGSTLTTGGLYVGGSGSGTLKISGGAAVISPAAALARAWSRSTAP